MSKIYTIPEAAAIIGCHESTLRRRVRNGKVPSILVAGQVGITPETVRAEQRRLSGKQTTKTPDKINIDFTTGSIDRATISEQELARNRQRIAEVAASTLQAIYIDRHGTRTVMRRGR